MPRRRLLVGLISGVLALGGLLAVMPGQAEGAPVPGIAKFIRVKQDPPRLVFDSPSEKLTLVQEMDDVRQWTVEDADVYICAGGVTATTCRVPANYTINHNYLAYDSSKNVQNGSTRFITFSGDIPNQLRRFSYYVQVVYDIDPNPNVVTRATFRSYGLAPYTFGTVIGYGDTKTTITGPASIPTGSSLTLTGLVTCYSAVPGVGYKAPDQGGAFTEFLPKGTTTWLPAPANPTYNGATGAWNLFIGAWGSDGDWRTTGYGQGCTEAVSPVLNVLAGVQPPPPPPPLPTAPGWTLTGVTPNTATLAWTPATGTGIVGYRVGWTSASGIPVPSWSDVYASPPNPFVFTNLNPDSDYVTFIEAVTATGAGPRTTVAVHTAAAPPPVVVPPPPAAEKPGAVSGVGASSKQKAGNKNLVKLRWGDAPANGSAIDSWLVTGMPGAGLLDVGVHKLKAMVRDGKSLTLSVRACNAVGCGPASTVTVKA